jgi:hypothetical protein
MTLIFLLEKSMKNNKDRKKQLPASVEIAFISNQPSAKTYCFGVSGVSPETSPIGEGESITIGFISGRIPEIPECLLFILKAES